jgi:NAD+ synthase (glutamine-hydrolysing)
VVALPFVPREDSELHARCAEVFGIQCAGLAKRVSRLPAQLPLNIGVSGGLDSTLSLLVAVKTCEFRGWPVDRIAGITMPGFGTTSRTLQAARALMKHLGIMAEEIDIRQLCLDTFKSLKHKPFGIDASSMELPAFVMALQEVPVANRHDLVFENVQARVRTMLLMNRGFVLGTGDLSEQALGWCTYNGDHMSMYNVNTSIPKTLVKFLVKYVAEQEFDGEVRRCLLDIFGTPISPELLPPDQSGQIQQLTEGSIGAYELLDFFLYHFTRFGSTPKKILHLASLTKFSKDYGADEIRKTLRTFLTRFFANQFKRSCVPDGPKVGTVSLSPRGDWRMPSDAEAQAWLSELDD